MSPGGVTDLGPGEVVAAVYAFRDALSRHRETINRLNVFPVPDGDTGTNMLATVEAAASELTELTERDGGFVPPMAEVAEAVAHGSLMGARGNSGVILCQVLRGMASSFAALERVGGQEVARALDDGSRQAREAVLQPAEGTILSVARAAAEAACSAAAEGVTLVGVVEAARAAAVEALAQTPDQLAVLREAGVVDAGGAGLVLLYDALLSAADGRPLPEVLELPDAVAAAVASGGPLATTGALRADGDGAPGAGSPRYEVMYLLSADDSALSGFKRAWAYLGNSIVVVGGGGLWNCHIHTDDVGAAIEAAIDVGRPRDIRVSDLSEQIEEERWVREAGATPPAPVDEKVPTTAVVAVASGEGIERLFHSLGVQHLVEGGQSMNPSTRELLEIIETSPAPEVVVLPNNANIIPVARQAAALTDKKVRVVSTEGIQEALAALLEYDPDASGEANEAAMAEAAGRIVAGEVTRAVRSTVSRAGKVEAGDFIGLSRTGIVSVSAALAEATIGLIEALLGPTCEIVTIVEGEGSNAKATRQITEWLAGAHPQVSAELHHGGQPLYPYLVSVE